MEQHRRFVESCETKWGIVMPEDLFRHELHDFAVELRKLAYTMPAGHEDRLIHLSERMVRRSRQSVRTVDTG